MVEIQTDPLSALEAKLFRYPQVKHRRVRGGVEIDPPNDGGFGVGIFPNEEGWVVNFGRRGCHEHFDDPHEALEFVAFGLSNACRLREISISCLKRSVVEVWIDNDWVWRNEVAWLGRPFPLRRTERMFQNSLIHTEG